MDMEKYLDLFVSEANEHIQAAGAEVARLSSGLTTPEILNRLFRHFHSIKGMAASMGFEEISSLSHSVEDLFDALRKRGESVPGAADVVMEALDSISTLVAQSSGGSGSEAAIDVESLASRIRALVPPPPPARHPSPAGDDFSSSEKAPGPGARQVRCLLRVHAAAEFRGARAALAVKKLEQLGQVLNVEPSIAAFSGPDFKGEVSVLLATGRSDAAVLESVQELLDIDEVDLVESPGPYQPDSPAQTRSPQSAEADMGRSRSTVRIPTATLDMFLDSISEMMSRRGALAEAIRSREMPAARESLRKLSDLIDDLREQVMLVRLMPFEHLSPRLTRTVRELCRKTGKRAVLTITGGDVSLDRSVLDEIVDPLDHLLRNAVDHGIEPPAERERCGKPSSGTLRIEVSRQRDRVLVCVEDDGRGMDRDAIRRTAVENGFAAQADLASMSEDQVLMLTTIPGFSTSRKVTDVSGRGVGMDVVRTRIEAAHGHIKIHSRRGEGTRIEMDMPLTLAVIDAFLVEGKTGLFAVPAAQVCSVMLVEPDRIRSTLSGLLLAPPSDQEGTDPASFTPLVMLDEALGRDVETPPRDEPSRDGPARLAVLAYQIDGARGALGVSRIRERRELVVKPLGAPLEHLRKYSGAALLDDGSLALILDLVHLGRN